MPTPLPPSTAIRSPYQSSASNGSVSPATDELFGDHGPLAGAGAAQPHVDLLVAQLGRSLVLVEELAQLRLGRLELRRERLADLGALAHQHDVVLEALASRRRTSAVSRARFSAWAALAAAYVANPAAVRPGAGCLDRDDLGGAGGQQLAVVADEQHGLPGGVELAFQPPLGGHVEEVVGLVEHEDVVLSAQQVLERQSFLLAAAEGSQRPVGNVAEVDTEGAAARLVPSHLDVVATRVAPGAERLGVSHRIGRRSASAPAPGGRAACRIRSGDSDNSSDSTSAGPVVADRAHADQLAHHPDPSVDRDRAGSRLVLADQRPAAVSTCRPRWRRSTQPGRRCRPKTRCRGTAPHHWATSSSAATPGSIPSPERRSGPAGHRARFGAPLLGDDRDGGRVAVAGGDLSGRRARGRTSIRRACRARRTRACRPARSRRRGHSRRIATVARHRPIGRGCRPRPGRRRPADR